MEQHYNYEKTNNNNNVGMEKNNTNLYKCCFLQDTNPKSFQHLYMKTSNHIFSRTKTTMYVIGKKCHQFL